MRIVRVNDNNTLVFDTGDSIYSNHQQECCEYNYPDFTQLEDQAFQTDFSEDLTFEEVEGAGFRFGSVGTPMFFVPCYSEQNGYYSSDLEIYYGEKRVLYIDCIVIE